jgi:Flp pilus assembly protein TadD
LVAVGIAAGKPAVSAAATVKELQQQAKAHLAKRQPDRAKPILETILDTATVHDLGAIRDAARYLAMIAIEQRTVEAFLAQAEQELGQRPDDPVARWKVIEGFLAIGRRQEAIVQLRTLLDQAPRDEYLRARLAQAYASDGQLEQALAVVQEGLNANPGSVRLAETVADAYVRANQPQEAVKHYEALLTKSTDERRKAFYRSRIKEIGKAVTESP